MKNLFKGKFLLLIVLLLIIFTLSSCEKRETSKSKNDVEEFITKLRNKYPNDNCLSDGWYQGIYHEKNHELDKLVHIDTKCYFKFDDASNRFNIEKFIANKHVYTENLPYGFSTMLYDGINYYQSVECVDNIYDNNFYEKSYGTKNINIAAYRWFDPLTTIITFDPRITTAGLLYDTVDYYEKNNLIVYKKIDHTVNLYSEVTYYFDYDLNYLMLNVKTSEKHKGQNEEAIDFRDCEFTLVKSNEIIIDVPLLYESENSEFLKDEILTFDEIFLNVEGALYYD